MHAVLRPSSRPGGRRLESDAGVTLIELLITIVITGILFAALLGGLASMVKTSALHRRQADVGTVVRNAAEAVKQAPYEPCLAAAYTTALNGVAHPSDVGVPALVGVTKIDRTACAGADPGLQMVQISATSSDGKTSDALWVVKANR